jgi:uncharacterized protein (DUF927 family)
MSVTTLAQKQTQIQELESTHKFLDFIFSPHKGRGFIELRYFGGGKSPKVKGSPDYFSLPFSDNTEELNKKILQRINDQMITFGPAPRMRKPNLGKAGKDADIAEVSCIWADLDYDKYNGGAMEVAELINGLELKPSIVVSSGFGKHLYYCLEEPMKDEELLNWKSLIVSLRDVLGSDAVINPSRVMRLPGTYNIKHEQPVLAEITENQSSWARYSPKELEFIHIARDVRINKDNSNKSSLLIPPADNKSTTSEREKDVGIDLNGKDENNSKKIPALTPDEMQARGASKKVIDAVITGKYTIRTGPNAGRSDDQSSRDFWIASSLIESGFAKEEVKRLFRRYLSGCGSKVAQSAHGEEYLNLTVEKASAQVNAKLAQKGEYGILTDFDPKSSVPPGYQLNEDGTLWLVTPPRKEGGEPKYTLVSESPIYISEIHENVDNGQISMGVSYKYLERKRTTVITRSEMCEARLLVKALSNEGGPVSSNNARLVVAFLTSYEHYFSHQIKHKKVTSKFGRGSSGKTFFLPGLEDDIEFAPVGPGDYSIYRAFESTRGSFSVWRDAVNILVDRNLLIPQIAVCAAFIPPLQRFLQIPNFILDIHGNTSSGKSTTLKIAASVYGKPNDPDGLIHQWMNTNVAIEQVAGMCSELPIFLDDAQHCPAYSKKSIIYMIANGKGKGRGAKGGGVRETPNWNTVALSTSEEPLHESSPHEGARGRILPIGGLYPPFPQGSGDLVHSLEDIFTANHGLAGQMFIKHINNWTESKWMEWQRRYHDLREELGNHSSSDIVGRVSGYIASIAVAAEIVSPFMGLRFKSDVIASWLMHHLQAQQTNQNIVLLALSDLADDFVSNANLYSGTAKYDASRGSLRGVVKQGEYVGFLRKTIDNVFLPKKWNQTAILNKMSEAGVLYSTERNRHTKKVMIDGVTHRMICIKWSAILPDDIEQKVELA